MTALSISVVTPSYNQAPFLEATIRSVLDQAYPNLEYLVMDGGSTDGSVEIITRYASRLAHWVSRRDDGQADAINTGWARSRGELLAYINSDDLYLPGAFRRAAEHFAQHPETEVLYGSLQLIGERGEPLGRPVEAPEFSFRWLLRNPLPQPTIFFRRRVWERVRPLERTLHYTFDWDFCLRVAVEGFRIDRLPGAPLAAFRCWGGQKTSNRFERQIVEQHAMRDRLAANPKFPSSLAGALQFSKAWGYLWPAYQCYLQGDMAGARRLLQEAPAIDRRILAHPEFLGLYGRTLLGSRLSRAARRLKSSVTGARHR